MPMEMKQFARPAHCWPLARAGIHSPAEVSPMSQPTRWCGASQVPAKPMRMAATPTIWKAAFTNSSGVVFGGALAAEDWDGGGRRGGAVAARPGVARSVRLLFAPDPCGGSEGEDGDRGGRQHHGAESVQETGGGGARSRRAGELADQLPPAARHEVVQVGWRR